MPGQIIVVMVCTVNSVGCLLCIPYFFTRKCDLVLVGFNSLRKPGDFSFHEDQNIERIH